MRSSGVRGVLAGLKIQRSWFDSTGLHLKGLVQGLGTLPTPVKIPKSWAVSSVGRAGALQASGQEFEPPTVHTYRDSTGEHGQKPTLNGDLAVANANS